MTTDETDAARVPTHALPVIGHMAALDGVRGIAVLLVMGYHAGFPFLRGGNAGVDVFFVLSGFLITALLLQESQTRGRIKLGAFYMRRALRLYPALIVGVLLAVCLAWAKVPVFGASSTSLEATLEGTPFALFYTMNIARAAGWAYGGFLGHTWSLAIEEQFYLIWPLAVIVMLHRRAGLALLAWVAASCAVLSAALRAVLDLRGFDSEMLYNFTLTHVDGIFAGCAAAVIWVSTPGAIKRLSGPVLLTSALVVGGTVIVRGQHMNLYGFAVVVMSTVLVLADLLTRPRSTFARVLGWSPFVEVGRRSYGLYLYHWPIFLFIGIDSNLGVATLGFVLSFVAAWLSYAAIEKPFLRMKKRWSS